MGSTNNRNSLLVGVIASGEELRLAPRLRRPPDRWEMRLDCLPNLSEKQCAVLTLPVIMTARHPAEGGQGNLTTASREALLLRFLPQAAAVDLELRSLRSLARVWDLAGQRGLTRICSLHDFKATPGLPSLRRSMKRAMEAGCDIFKVATRAATPADFVTLLKFCLENEGNVAVVAIGPFGPLSRKVFPRCGSRLVYAPLRYPLHPGQPTLKELQRSLGY